MDTSSRRFEIMQVVRDQGRVSATAIAARLGVAVQTIRRDLRVLCSDGLLERTHGGAVLPSGVKNIGYMDRRSLNREEKRNIGRVAAALIPDNSSLFLNIGTTTEAVAHALRDHRNMMVVTNNLNVANILADAKGCEVIVAGGRLRRADGGLVGDLAALAIERFQVDFAVIGASAIDPDGHLLDFDPEEVRVSRQILDAARASIAVADASKFSRKAPVRIARLQEVDYWVTDRLRSERLAQSLLDAGTQVHLASGR